MLRLLGNPKVLCDGLTRRDLLHIGGLGAFGVALHDFLGWRQAQAKPIDVGPKFGQAKSCILIYKYGSPPQHETFDPKPEAPAEIQGEMKAIPTNVPGIHIGDHLPKIARIMDRLTVVRSLTHPYPLHGTVYATTGIPEVDTKIEAQPRHNRQWPFIGSLVDYFEDRRTRGKLPEMPRNVALPFVMGSKNEYPHHNHYGRLKEFLLPVFDHTFSALILDLEQRGLLDETLVLVISEHGRTPQIDSKPKGAGRHHWSRAYSQVYAGGGMGHGHLVGRTDKHAGDVEETPISPKDVLATAFHLLGIDPESTFPDPQGRPLPISGTGRFRPELLG